MSPPIPFAIIDQLDMLESSSPPPIPLQLNQTDLQQCLSFLKLYDGSKDTLASYRRELERFLQWLIWIAQLELKQITTHHIEAYLAFCQKPPLAWIGTKVVARFIDGPRGRQPNPAWRPFVVKVAKSQHSQHIAPDPSLFKLSDNALLQILRILSSFFRYCVDEDYCHKNPVAKIRQKSKFIRKQQTQKTIRRLSDLQWKTVIHLASQMAEQDPDKHERTLFIMSALYLLYLRVSELTASDRWTPQMGDFYRDNDNRWWFTTVGKGNKQRQITVSDDMLRALKRWRKHLSLPTLPYPGETTPLICKQRGQDPISSTRMIRLIVQSCFDQAIEQLNYQGDRDEAEALSQATVHWLRHTGISDDVQHRPREHVRDDAGHSSSAITDRYIDVELKQRHQSGRHKKLIDGDD